MNKKPAVIIGFLGTQLDSGIGPGRWEKWRPTVSLGMHEHFLVARMELLVDQRQYGKLATAVRDDLAQVSPETEVRLHDMYFADPWDFESMYAALHQFCREYPFDAEAEDYYLHITTGTHVAQIASSCSPRAGISRDACCRLRRHAISVQAARRAHSASSTSIFRSTTASPSASRKNSRRIARSSRAASPRAIRLSIA